ncbi:uncharacterized protein Bfra_007388 [Botrytis fragariae]|uniref:Uncharacterized protein n=1 Tax=Botrytis fragariae TaxID=1964551 RepID=A0A8H6AIE9_9HELO|nr:uncharacterized protein Bfra_007388 [Botrytis fragariae]KAF5868192.1 hypothetical protein Bfra_007388 [Botrytis fragariae]
MSRGIASREIVWITPISDPSLDRADVSTLRKLLEIMEERHEISDGVANDFFLVVNELLLNHSILLLQIPYTPKAPKDSHLW